MGNNFNRRARSLCFGRFNELSMKTLKSQRSMNCIGTGRLAKTKNQNRFKMVFALARNISAASRIVQVVARLETHTYFFARPHSMD
jgi:hypothetical protein